MYQMLCYTTKKNLYALHCFEALQDNLRKRAGDPRVPSLLHASPAPTDFRDRLLAPVRQDYHLRFSW